MHAAIRGGAELIGTALLVAAVIGSGIMAEAVTSDVGLRLLLNQLSTILGLGCSLLLFCRYRGPHQPGCHLCLISEACFVGG